MAEWLGCWTCNLVVPGSSPPSCHVFDLFSVTSSSVQLGLIFLALYVGFSHRKVLLDTDRNSDISVKYYYCYNYYYYYHYYYYQAR